MRSKNRKVFTGNFVLDQVKRTAKKAEEERNIRAFGLLIVVIIITVRIARR
jgi:hypothetical protein